MNILDIDIFNFKSTVRFDMHIPSNLKKSNIYINFTQSQA